MKVVRKLGTERTATPSVLLLLLLLLLPLPVVVPCSRLFSRSLLLWFPHRHKTLSQTIISFTVEKRKYRRNRTIDRETQRRLRRKLIYTMLFPVTERVKRYTRRISIIYTYLYLPMSNYGGPSIHDLGSPEKLT